MVRNDEESNAECAETRETTAQMGARPILKGEKIAILVAGMHRSGTSALARMLSLLGCDLPKTLMPANPSNELGYWESQAIMKLNDAILESAGSTWNEWEAFNQGWYTSPLVDEFRERAQATLENEFNGSLLFVLKDPRICRLLKFWIEATEAFGATPLVVSTIRNPLEVAASLEKRDGINTSVAQLVWLRHVLDAEAASRNLKRAYVRYEDLLVNWQAVADRVGDILEISWPRHSTATEMEIENFLSPAQRHHKESDTNFLRNSTLSQWIRSSFAIVTRWAHGEVRETDTMELDRIRTAFNEAAPVFSRSITVGQQAVQRCRSLEAQADELQGTLKAREAEVQEVRGKLLSQEARAAELEAALKVRKPDIGDLQAKIRSEQARADDLEARLQLAENRSAELEAAIKVRDADIADLQTKLKADQAWTGELQAKLSARERDLKKLKQSLSWRLTKPLRAVYDSGEPILQIGRGLFTFGWWLGTGQFSRAATALLPYYERYVPPRIKAMIPTRARNGVKRHLLGQEVKWAFPQLEAPVERFDAWLDVNRWNARKEAHLRQRIAQTGPALPRISIAMPVYNAPVRLLKRAVESVQMQMYNNWELCIADDCSTDLEMQNFLRTLVDHPGILVTFRTENGNIAKATNSAAQLATGDFLMFLDQDDELTGDCLAEVALYVATIPETDLVFSDSDKIDEHGKRYHPAFKPDWSPEMLLSFMYAGQVLAVRRELFEAVGGLRPGFEGSQDHDLALRVMERARHVGHIPKILYHWRSLPGSTARSGKEKPYAVIAGQKAVQEALQRRGSRAIAVQPEWAERGGNSLFVHEFPDEGPAVTLIIPTRNNKDILERCIKSLERTTYSNWKVIIVDNDSDQPETLDFLAGLDHEVMRVASPRGGFNFAYLNNKAVAAADTDYVLLLNDDTEVVEPRWLSNMMGYAQQEGVGAVGAQLRLPDGRIQHAGVVHGLHDGLAGHAFKLLPQGQNGYLSMVEVPRNCAAVTAACMLTRRSMYLDLGGLDEEHLGVAYNDPDYCYRLLERGYRVIYCPNARLLHHEGATRTKRDDAREVATFRHRYGNWADPYYNPNLSLEDEQFRIQPRCVVLGERLGIRILVCTHNLNWEGAPYSQLEVVTELKRQGIIDPVVLSPRDGPLRSEYEKAGCQVIVETIPIDPRSSLRDYRHGVTKLAEQVLALDVEVVYANTLQTYYAVDAARHAGIPMVWNVRESEDWRTYFDFLSPDVRMNTLRNFAYPYRVVFVTYATRRRYSDLETRYNFTVIRNGLALEPIKTRKHAYTLEAARQRLGLVSTDVMFLLLGTVCQRKGQQELIEAAMQLSREQWSRMRLYIVGDRPSPYSDDLHALISNLPEWARRRVTVVPETDETALYYQAADVFVCTSRVESYPRVTLEAMAYELPIITTPVFGIAEQVQEGVNGLFYPPGDPSALAGHMGRLLEDVSLRERMGAASPDVLRSLPSFETMVRAYAAIFREASLSSVPDLDNSPTSA